MAAFFKACNVRMAVREACLGIFQASPDTSLEYNDKLRYTVLLFMLFARNLPVSSKFSVIYLLLNY